LAGFIPEDKISEIQNSVDIVDIISEVVLLKQTGRNYTGLCPFHSEKSPSFSVSREKQIFYCFGCGAGGNVFSFLMKQESLSFVEAVKKLSVRAGIELPDQEMSPEMKKRINEKEQLYTINKYALAFFQKCLLGSSGLRAVQYMEARGIKKEIIDFFQIGFAPRGWDNLVQFFSKMNIRLDTVEKAGLIAARPSGKGFYDRFRERIMFPIFNTRKQVVGFGGRVMDDSLPKYLNTPETPIFNKSRNLYGLCQTRDACREASEAFVVEGYFDLIALYQHGIENVAATLGTALTSDHVRILRGFVKKAILVFDSDDAGAKAAVRSISLFRQENVEARVLVLPKGDDPDSFVFRLGAEAFYAAADQALGIVPFLIESAIEKHGLSMEGKLLVVSEMKGPLSAINDPVARSIYIKELSERINVDQNAVLEIIRKESFKSQKCNPYSKGPSRGFTANPVSREEQSSAKTPVGAAHRAESKIISMMLQCPEMIPEIVSYDVLELFEDENLKSLGKAILFHGQSTGSNHIDPADLLPFLETKFQRSLVASLAMDDEDCWNESQGRKRQLIFQFMEYAKGRKEKKIIEKIRAAEANNDMELLAKLLSKQQKLALASQEKKMALLKQLPTINILE
jgi:DNA primase